MSARMHGTGRMAAVLGRLVAVGLMALAMGPRAAQASDGEHDSQRLGPPARATAPAAWQAECAACHVAYPPGMLPAPSWQRILGSLERHYGVDASVDEATVQTLGRWLGAHAATRGRQATAPPQDRITRSEWFVRKHRRVDAATWALPSVRSAAQCTACHAQAAQGEFDDDRGLQRPAGLSERQWQAWRH